MTAVQTEVPCPICGEAATLHDALDFNRSATEELNRNTPRAGVVIEYFLCDECGHCFAPEFARWTREDFAARIYNGDYLKHDPDYADRRPRANAKTLVKLLGAHGPRIRHLDYGSGGGLMTDLLREAGWQSSAYDPFAGEATSAAAAGQDLITAFEVFEHVPDAMTLVADLNALLVPDGVIVFSTLISDKFVRRGRPLDWWYAAPRNGHISLYSSTSLVLAGASQGFTFGSLSDVIHAYWRQPLPAWARQFIKTE